MTVDQLVEAFLKRINHKLVFFVIFFAIARARIVRPSRKHRNHTSSILTPSARQRKVHATVKTLTLVIKLGHFFKTLHQTMRTVVDAVRHVAVGIGGNESPPSWLINSSRNLNTADIFVLEHLRAITSGIHLVDGVGLTIAFNLIRALDVDVDVVTVESLSFDTPMSRRRDRAGRRRSNGRCTRI